LCFSCTQKSGATYSGERHDALEVKSISGVKVLKNQKKLGEEHSETGRAVRPRGPKIKSIRSEYMKGGGGSRGGFARERVQPGAMMAATQNKTLAAAKVGKCLLGFEKEERGERRGL